jgi:hypothetical protein
MRSEGCVGLRAAAVGNDDSGGLAYKVHSEEILRKLDAPSPHPVRRIAVI